MRIRSGVAAAVVAVACAWALAGCGQGAPAPQSTAAAAASPAPAAAAPSYPTITAIHAMGTRRYTSAEIARASGLRIGQRFSSAAVHAAEERLAASGAFTSVDSLLVPSDNGQIVDFELTDNPHFYPVSFAGFDQWSAARLRAYLRRTAPLFTGEVPLLRLGVAHRVQHSLQDLAGQQHWPGRVAMHVSLVNGSSGVEYRLAR